VDNKYAHILAMDLNLVPWQVENTLKLFAAGATIPFISRYRKEATGSLDEVQITQIRDLHVRFQELDKRRESILKSISEQGKLTDELKERLNNALTLSELEDLYLPFKPRKKTRALIPREKGLEPLALMIMKQSIRDPAAEAVKFLSDAVADVEDA